MDPLNYQPPHPDDPDPVADALAGMDTIGGVPTADVEASMRRLERGRRERKAAELDQGSFAIPGLDNVWCFPSPPMSVWTTRAGLPGATAAGPMPSVNGYVQLPPDHPWNALDTTDGVGGDHDYEVASGLTWHHHPSRWIGFDTMHAFQRWDWHHLSALHEDGRISEDTWTRWQMHREWTAAMDALARTDPWTRTWTLERVIADVETLAAEARGAMP